MKKRLSSVDWAFLQTETPSNLAHVAGLWVFKLPKGYRKKFFREYLDGLENARSATPPFNYKLSSEFDLPSWIEDPDFDLANHVHQATLPRPGSMEQLLEMVSGLHSQMLDRSRPLWECYLIEGIAGKRVAFYLKVHHALFDGVSAMECFVGSLLKSAGERATRAVWQPPVRKQSQHTPTGLLKRLGKVSAGLVEQARTLPELSTLIAKDGLQVLNLVKGSDKAPFTAPRSPLGKAITPDRTLAVKSFSLPRIKELGKESGSTINDLILAMSAGALRSYFLESGNLPEKPLTAWVPVSLRTGDGGETGNQVSVLVSSLATDLEDPCERLDAIKTSIRLAKEKLRGQSARTADNYTQLLSGLIVLTQVLGVAERVAPAANLVISNVPGSRETLYLNGATLVEQYPISMLLDGMALNITVTSHDDRLDFGLTACPNAVPDPKRLANYLESTLKELEKETLENRIDRGSEMTKDRTETSRQSDNGSYLKLMTSLAAIPMDTLNRFILGESLNRKAVSELQASLDRMEEVTQSLQAAPDDAVDIKRECLNGPDPALMKAQAPLWNALMNYYFRLEINGWERFPDEPALFIGVHSGGPLTMDAWTVAMAWWRHFEGKRTLHGTAHDVLMNSPGIGRYFRRVGTISPSRETISAAFAKGDDVILWPGGEKDAYRSWDKRDRAVLGGRQGFIRLAIREQVPIIPVATIGGHDTLFVLSEGRGLARKLRLKERMRVEVAPITLSIPFGVTLHLTPFQHIPLPAKIRTEFLDPIYFDTDPDLENDNEYVDKMYREVESAIQAGMDHLATKRKFPVFG